MDWDTPVTLFVANILPTLPDTFIRRILQQCGTVTQWRRAIGVKDDPCDFGFVDYGSPADALRALRILPQICVLDKTWIATVDRSMINDLRAFEQARNMRTDFDEEKELRKDQLILHMVNELISSSAFARAVPRLTSVLFSPNDEARTSEHYRYLNEIHRENDELEEVFRTELIEWRKSEVLFENEMKQMESLVKSVQNLENNQEEQDFLREWKWPELTEVNEEEENRFVEAWKRYDRIREKRRLIRKKEEELEAMFD
jgi:RNA recognition motif-containing protein